MSPEFGPSDVEHAGQGTPKGKELNKLVEEGTLEKAPIYRSNHEVFYPVGMSKIDALDILHNKTGMIGDNAVETNDSPSKKERVQDFCKNVLKTLGIKGAKE
jgi:hypothetical protein